MNDNETGATMRMIRRRSILSLIGSAPLLSATARAAAASPEKATAFLKVVGDRLIGVVNGAGSPEAKRKAMTQILNDAVDVDGIAKFCLGRFWRTATPEQQHQYTGIFHEVLVTNITSKLGEYRGVSYTMGRARLEGDNAIVSTIVERPNNPPTNVDWVIAEIDSGQKIIDVLAEGTSLRLTQRQDYASYLQHNNNSVDALISAMKNQIAQNG